MKEIGNRIKKIRKILNKSQTELAQELGLTKQAISNIEHSKSLPSISFLSKLLIDYGININYIISSVGEVFIDKEKNYKSLKESILNEVETFLNSRGIS